ncbi:SET and MYND domain-containing protein 3, partial [Blyttiomyces sp. JEL0837]
MSATTTIEEDLPLLPSLIDYLATLGLSLTRSKDSSHRMLVTTRDRHAGDIIFHNNAVATSLLAGHHRQRCEWCLKSPQSSSTDTPAILRNCSRCKKVAYCSVDCQKQDWVTGAHKLFCCKVMAYQGLMTGFTTLIEREAAEAPMRRDEEMVVKTECYLQSLTNNAGKPSPPSEQTNPTFSLPHGYEKDCVSSLVTGKQVMVPESIRLLTHLATSIQKTHFKKPPLSLPDSTSLTNKLISHGRKIIFNGYGIGSVTMDVTYADGFFPLGALCNHSCDPSCSTMYLGRRQTARALRDLKAGDELTFSYCDSMTSVDANAMNVVGVEEGNHVQFLTLSKEEGLIRFLNRRRDLKARHGFSCR